MQKPIVRFTLAATAVIAAAALSGCGASASKPDPTPVSTHPTGYEPAPPHLPASHPVGAIFIVDLADRAAVRPATVQFASNGTLQRMLWSDWGGPVVEGHGTAVVRICSPSCVDGHTAAYPVTVTLSSRKSCFGAHFYGDSSVIADTRHGRQRLASFIRNPC